MGGGGQFQNLNTFASYIFKTIATQRHTKLSTASFVGEGLYSKSCKIGLLSYSPLPKEKLCYDMDPSCW